MLWSFYEYELTIPLYTIHASQGIDSESNLQILPRLLFTVLAICSDYYFLRLCKTVLADTKPTEGSKYDTLSVPQCAFIVHVLSWSVSYCLPRTLGNSLETTLLIIGTSLLFTTSTSDIKKKDYVSSTAVVLAAISVYCRPTAVLIWVNTSCFILSHTRIVLFLWLYCVGVAVFVESSNVAAATRAVDLPGMHSEKADTP